MCVCQPSYSQQWRFPHARPRLTQTALSLSTSLNYVLLAPDGRQLKFTLTLHKPTCDIKYIMSVFCCFFTRCGSSLRVMMTYSA